MRVLENWDVTSLYPSLVELYNYSSRNQQSASDYIDLLHKRKKAKKGKLPEEFLKEFNVTNDELKVGLKLPLNAYTGTLRAVFNKLYDPLQGFSICTTGQLFILQLIYDLQSIPTLEMVSANTDAVMYTIEEEYKEQAHDVLRKWESHTGLELEEDKVVKIYMRDVNNYCELVQIGENDYKVNYKGGEFKGIHKFKWDKEKHRFNYSFEDDIEANSLTIVSEALIKRLLFDVPIEETINNCNDIFRFQIINHTGNTYIKCVQETKDGDVEVQKNNRIYASNIPNGPIVKIKQNGQRDTLALCPPNPIVDNSNKCTIEDINKEWYIKIAKQKLNDFLGIKRLTEYKKEELLTIALNKGIIVDKKIKKDELIKLIEEKDEVERMATKVEKKEEIETMSIYKKISEMTKEIRKHDFVLDCVNPSNLGGKEYASISQYYNVIHNLCDKYNLLFQWSVIEFYGIEKDVFKPVGKMPSHVATVRCVARFINLDNPTESFDYHAIASGSDISDKSVSGASTLAFRNWFDKNFTPKYLNSNDEEVASEEEKTEAPKVPTYIPQEKKEEIKKEIVETKQPSDEEDIKEIVDKIMQVRELINNPDWGKETLKQMYSGELTSADILSIGLKVDAKLESVGGSK